ncbi:MAG: hypothetical protein M9951_00005 [Burkholderiaceae bacterium]|nr:hypothetical protein [Burkholderiaceae bacterium]
MTTTTYPSQGSIDAMGSGVERFYAAPTQAPAIAAAPGKSLFRRAWDAFLRNREEAALIALARMDRRLAAEIRVARDRADWQV